MSFVRPEVREALSRWRQLLIGLAVCAAALWFIVEDYGLRRWIAVAAFGVGAVLTWEGIRRARFPAEGGGPGVVEVDERQITYFGPAGGASISIEDLVHVTIRTTDDGPFASDLFWDFTTDDGKTMSIPGDAERSEAIFDVLTALPGADYEAVTRASAATDHATFVVWRKPRQRLH